MLLEVSGTALGARLSGYEMHMGVTQRSVGVAPFVRFDDGGEDGAIDPTGRIIGSYVHGLLAEGGFRAALLDRLGVASDGLDHGWRVDAALDELAAAIEAHLDVSAMIDLARAGRGRVA